MRNCLHITLRRPPILLVAGVSIAPKGIDPRGSCARVRTTNALRSEELNSRCAVLFCPRATVRHSFRSAIAGSSSSNPHKRCDLTILWCNILQFLRHCCDFFGAFLQMHPFVRRGLMCQADTGAPFLRRSDRPRGETTTAVWADIGKFVFGAVGTEGAFIGTDARLCR